MPFLIFFVVITLYHFFIYKYDLFCVFNILFLLLISKTIFDITFNNNKIKRKCFINCIFEKKSFLYKVLNNYLLIIIISLITAILYSVIFIIFVIKIETIDLIIIFIGIFLSSIWFNKLSSIGIKKEYNKWILIKLISVASSSLITLILIIKNYYFSTLPNFLDSTLLKTYQNISNIYYSKCWVIQKLLNYSNLLDAINGFIAEKAILLDLHYLIKIFVVFQFLLVNFIGIISFHYLYFFIKKELYEKQK